MIALTGCEARRGPSEPIAPVSRQQNPANATPQAPANPPPKTPPQQPTANVAPATNPTAGNDIIATLGDIQITRAELEKPLFESYGLSMLGKVATLAYVKHEARQLGILVTAGTVSDEVDRYLTNLFNEEKDPVLRELNMGISKAEQAKDQARLAQLRNDLRRERYRLLDQLLSQQKVTRADFDLVMETNTYLRKIGQTHLKKEPITDEALRSAFNMQYGEKAQTRIIQLANLEEATNAKRRLASGESFERVARDMSRDPQAAQNGGELPPFTRDTPNLPQQFKDVAFGLKTGEVSDAVAVDGQYYIIRLDAKIPPRVIKFEDVKESVREALQERLLDGAVRDMRARVQQGIGQSLKVNEPTLKAMYEQEATRRDDQVQDRSDVRRDWEMRRNQIIQRGAATTQSSTTAPATQPTTAPGR